jgi:hypothetical protein
MVYTKNVTPAIMNKNPDSVSNFLDINPPLPITLK